MGRVSSRRLGAPWIFSTHAGRWPEYGPGVSTSPSGLEPTTVQMTPPLPWNPALSAALLTLTIVGCAPGVTGRFAPTASYRIFDAAAGRFVDLDVLSEAAARADYVLFGEHHDDVIAHRLQTELLQQVALRRETGVLGMEMFERDVQPVLDALSTGSISVESLPDSARPWPNYAADYAPTVEAALRAGWRVAGTNLPQTLASAIAREGLQAMEALPPDQRDHAASAFFCPPDEYWDRFREAMAGPRHSTTHGGADADEEMIRRFYQAQCARDETMAESLVDLGTRGVVLHLNGTFHSDFGQGIVPRLLRRRPNAHILVISALPVPDLQRVQIVQHRERADFIIFTRGGSQP
jgi:uncharacterized iron-regulated protein